MEIGRAWAENAYVTKANLMHERVHDSDNNYISRGKKVYTSVPVYNDLKDYELYGVTDCLECRQDNNGVFIDESENKYKLCIVEYKPTKPKEREHREEDIMQVFAQKICVDYVFKCDSETVIYYADVKKRCKVSFIERYKEYDEKLKELLADMREKIRIGFIPPISKGQKCSGCSMKDMCMPSLRCAKDIKSELKKLQNE